MTDRTFTATEKLRAVERELKYRARVFPRRVSEKKMSQELADEQTAVFEAIRQDYVKLARQERLL